jgi:hypothetical protein
MMRDAPEIARKEIHNEYLVCPTDRHSDQSGFGDHRLRKRFESLLNCRRPACFHLNPGKNGFPLMETIWFGSLSLSVASCLLVC